MSAAICAPCRRAGQERLEGADATHAWVAVWCGPQDGWVGLDPTNKIAVGDDHIVLAEGRDYSDISPIDGVILSSGGQDVDVAVDVIPRRVGKRAADFSMRPRRGAHFIGMSPVGVTKSLQFGRDRPAFRSP